MKQLIKAMKTKGASFKYPIFAFSGMSSEKIRAGVFVVLQIRQLIKDDYFIGTMLEHENNVCLLFKGLVKNEL